MQTPKQRIEYYETMIWRAETDIDSKKWEIENEHEKIFMYTARLKELKKR